MEKRVFEVLLAEDDEADVDLIKRALENASPKVDLVVAEDGEAALRTIQERASDFDLVILDLNMPRKTGFDVLTEIRKDPRLNLIPVVVLTTSNVEPEILKAYSLGASCFITKPLGWDAFSDAVRLIVRFWLGLVSLPPVHGRS